MSGDLSLLRSLGGQSIQMTLFPPNYQIEDNYTAGIQLLRNGENVAMLAFNESKALLRNVNTGVPNEIAFAKNPSEYNLPLSSGWGIYHYSKYWKTQEGLTIVQISVNATSSHSVGTTIGTLPSGFRPGGIIETPAVLTTTNLGGYSSGTIQIQPNGAIQAYFDGTLGIDAVIVAMAVFISGN